MRLRPWLALLLAPLGPAWGQLASGPSARLDALEYDAAAGGSCSIGAAGWFAIPWIAGPALGPNAGGALGFLAACDPEPTNAPVLFGITPWFGTKDGGSGAMLSGLNFQKLGAGASLTALIGGNTASSIAVLSDTQVSLSTPPGAMGPADVRVATLFGADALLAGYVYTPAVLADPTAAIGSGFDVRDLGPAGKLFQLWTSPFATSVPLPPYGVLLIGPSSVFKLVEAAYPAGAIHTLALSVPNDPVLSGLPFHFQSVAILSLAPPVILLTNRSTTVFQ